MDYFVARRNRVLGVLLVAVLFAAALVVTQSARAASTGPSVSLSLLSGNLVAATGKNFPSTSSLTVRAVITGGGGQGTITTSATGGFAVTIGLPSTYKGAVTVTATSGAIHASGSITIGAPTTSTTAPASSTTTSLPRTTTTVAHTTTTITPVGKAKPVFAIYYLWWDKSHWTSHLGPSYPVTASPNPLPATLDSSSCGAVSSYGSANVLTDVSQGLAYNQDNPQTILNDVKLAASLGVTGFAVNWRGDGTAGQTTSSGQYNQRLQYMFDAVHAVNAQGTPFKLQLNYQGSAKILSLPTISNDINYFMAHYGKDSALDHTYSSKPEIVFAGTWKYSDSTLAAMSAKIRPLMYFIGDEKPATWNASRAASLDGAHYYWSSQDPYQNASSFGQLQKLATMVHSTKNPDGSSKTWLAPFTPGYNAALLYKTPTCVPRNNGQTMHVLFDGNLASNPDGWTMISWNEISEGSYIVPLTRYGNTYTNTLKSIIANNR